MRYEKRKNRKKCCGLCYRVACITRNFFKTQNPQLQIEIGLLWRTYGTLYQFWVTMKSKKMLHCLSFISFGQLLSREICSGINCTCQVYHMLLQHPSIVDESESSCSSRFCEFLGMPLFIHFCLYQFFYTWEMSTVIWQICPTLWLKKLSQAIVVTKLNYSGNSYSILLYSTLNLLNSLDILMMS